MRLAPADRARSTSTATARSPEVDEAALGGQLHPMRGKFLGVGGWAVSVLVATSAAAAPACLPPPPGWVEPTAEERARNATRSASDIVYGEIVGVRRQGRHIRLRVMHVYKGTARVGSILSMPLGWGLNPPPCAGMLGGPPPLPDSVRGERVVALVYSGSEAVNLVGTGEFALMLRLGLVEPGSHDPSGLRAN